MTTTPAANDAAAAAYHRLRSHLAYLKLAAAAEALPGILDAARDGRGDGASKPTTTELRIRARKADTMMAAMIGSRYLSA